LGKQQNCIKNRKGLGTAKNWKMEGTENRNKEILKLGRWWTKLREKIVPLA
jgi:hypothetical protein